MIIASQGNGGALDDSKVDGVGTGNSFLAIMKYLYDKGAQEDVHLPMNDGSTPMHYVAYNGDVEAAKWLQSWRSRSPPEHKTRAPPCCAPR